MPNPLIALLLFLSTNLDNLFLLLAFFVRPGYRAWQVIVGQFLGMGIILLICVAGALVALALPDWITRSLGIFPLLIGLRGVWQAWHQTDDDDPTVTAAHPQAARNILTVTLVTLANSGDNIGVYVPAFASQTHTETLSMIAWFGVYTLLLCLLPVVLLRVPGARDRLEGSIGRLLPWVLIGLGILILAGIW